MSVLPKARPLRGSPSPAQMRTQRPQALSPGSPQGQGVFLPEKGWSLGPRGALSASPSATPPPSLRAMVPEVTAQFLPTRARGLWGQLGPSHTQ